MLPYISDTQVALLDIPFSYEKIYRRFFFCEQELPQILHSLQGGDFILCSWTGSFLKLQQHGWRCTSAFVGGYLAAREDILTQSVVGHSFYLGNGRNITIERSSKLGGFKHKPIPSRFEDYGLVVEIATRRGKDFGQILSETSTRNLIMNGHCLF